MKEEALAPIESIDNEYKFIVLMSANINKELTMIQKIKEVLAEAVKYDLYMKYDLTTVGNKHAFCFSSLLSTMAKVKYKLTNIETKHSSTEAMLASTELNVITLGRGVNSLEKHVEDLITTTEVYKKIRNQFTNTYIYRTAPDLSVYARNNI